MEEIGGVWSSCADRELPAYYHWRLLFPLRWMILISNNCIPPSCIISAYVIVIPINHSSHLYILRIPAAEWYLPFNFCIGLECCHSVRNNTDYASGQHIDPVYSRLHAQRSFPHTIRYVPWFQHSQALGWPYS